jgi:hypothetical protein
MKVKSRLFPVILILGALITLTACSEPDPRYVYENDILCVGGDGKPIELINNSQARNPTYAELVAFIKQDYTDTKSYLEGGPNDYVCSDFAEDVHNNAEAAGIRAAWVGIDIYGDTGHACNAFETIDKGLVYVDCTGTTEGNYNPSSGEYLIEYQFNPDSDSSDADSIAYVEIGEDYGRIDIDYAESPDYGFYEEYMRKYREFENRLEAYNDAVDRHNQEIEGKVYIAGSSELTLIEAWEDRIEAEGKALDELRKELGESHFEQVGMVENIHVHW